MCGIVGRVHLNGEPIDGRHMQRMLNALKHRGPDDEGYLFVDTGGNRHVPVGGWDTPDTVFTSDVPYAPRQMNSCASSEGFDMALGHRRLSIIDLTPAGHQPMCNEDGTVWIVYNGEIYNFRELKRELVQCGHRFVSDTDTEVILHGYETWGVDCLKRFNGMWAFCIWDMKTRRLFCSRDRFGIKPFYYFISDKKLIFASEINALLIDPEIQKTINDRAVYGYLSVGLSDFGEETFFSRIHQLPSGQFLELNMDSGRLRTETYWKLVSPRPTSMGEQEATQHFRDLLEDSIRRRLVSDVPVGTCLSGGLDSSSIVCLISSWIRNQNRPLSSVGKIQRTFSSRYRDARHDEGRYIDAVVGTAKTKAYYVYPTPEKLVDDLGRLIERQGEPFASTSIFAQWCVFELARKKGVKVTLDGQGADEILAGYLPYFSAFWAGLFLSFHFLRLAREIFEYRRQRHPLLKFNLIQMFNHLTYSVPLRFFLAPLRNYLKKDALKAKPHGMRMDFMRRMDGISPPYERYPTGSINLNALLYQTLFYSSLPSYLRYDDRNSMAHGVESRVPFLDHRLVTFLFSLPEGFKIRNGTTKWILREAMKGVLPEMVRTRRDKIGFSTPEDAWIRGPLRRVIGEVVDSERFRSRPYFDDKKIKSVLESHNKGEVNMGEAIWRWFNLELWMRKFVD